MKMKRFFLHALVFAAGSLLATTAGAEIVISNAVEDLNHLGGGQQDRGEMILNNTGSLGGRFGAVRFDAAILSALPFTDSSQYTLNSASVVLTEQASRNGNNGTLSGRVGAYFFNTAENSDWLVNVAATTNSGNAGPDSGTPGDGWFGNTLARPGNVGGGAAGSGANNADERSDGLASGLDTFWDGTSFVNHTFDTANSAEVVTIDLTQGGASLVDIQSILADWVAGDNAGIGFGAEFGNQGFFQSNSVAAGNSVGSSIDGDTSLSGLALNSEGGTGAGTISLVLDFTAVTAIPEPGSAAFLGLFGAGFALRRRRKK